MRNINYENEAGFSKILQIFCAGIKHELETLKYEIERNMGVRGE